MWQSNSEVEGTRTTASHGADQQALQGSIDAGQFPRASSKMPREALARFRRAAHVARDRFQIVHAFPSAVRRDDARGRRDARPHGGAQVLRVLAHVAVVRKSEELVRPARVEEAFE